MFLLYDFPIQIYGYFYFICKAREEQIDEGGICHMLVHSLNACDNQGWGRPSREPRLNLNLSHRGPKPKDLRDLLPSPMAQVSRWLNRKLRAQTSLANLTCAHAKQWLNLWAKMPPPQF